MLIKINTLNFMSQFGSSIGEKKRLILKNPDGTYIHCKYRFLIIARPQKRRKGFNYLSTPK